jgi:hypothetical protein
MNFLDLHKGCNTVEYWHDCDNPACGAVDCLDCKTYWTECLGLLCEDCQNPDFDGEVRMEVMRCPAQQEYCLDCCGCPGH